MVFTQAQDLTCVTTIFRSDHVTLELPAPDRNRVIPHDIAHAVTERGLGMADGVFGTIASGGLFQGMRVIDGRPRHDAKARSERILAANKRALTNAEVMAAVVHDAVQHHRTDASVISKARHDWAIVNVDALPWTATQILACAAELRDLRDRWTSLTAEGVEFVWPERLTRPVPPAHRPVRAYRR